jgi:hypothetical protein
MRAMLAARPWLLSLSSVFALSAVVTLAAFSFGPGCQARCISNFECSNGGLGGAYCSSDGVCTTDCFTDLDCRQPPECQNNPSACVPKGLFCTGLGKCIGSYAPQRSSMTRMAPDTGGPSGPVEGWDLQPASGKAFIINQIAIAGKDRGFDLDGNCDQTTGNGCVDNILWQLGELGNDQIRQGLLGGESLLLMELAGLDDPYHGDDKSVTVKIYGARDADDPFFPANNFKVPPGHTTCCEFKINPQSITSPPPQARARAPAKIERGRLFSLAPVPIQFTLTVGAPPHPEIRLERVLISARIPSTVSTNMPGALGIDEGLLGGAVPINTLAQTENPYCKTVSPRCTVQFTDSTLIDLVATLLSPTPDIDLQIPPDGLEAVLDVDGDGRICLCCAGNGLGPAATNNHCNKAVIEPLDPAPDKKWTCALNPKVADGYSVGITFTAVQARIVGVGQ